MLFNSIDFALFLPLTFGIYWALGSRRRRLQNGFILVASYVFYAWWDWRFLSLILVSSVVDFTVGLALDRREGRGRDVGSPVRKLLLGASLLTNLGLLGFFKYYGFFVNNFAAAFTFFGAAIPSRGLDIVLPVGISFYTFQTLSYTIDVFRRRLPATRDFVGFLAYVAFFPQLVAGPIERAENLLPQFQKERRFSFDFARSGMRHILWGLFKKVAVADSVAIVVEDIFASYGQQSSLTLALGVFLFSIQIYCDFSGYSDIAIGVARLFGFKLMRNFAYPYFARDIAEFWRRWHISLSTWFRDYLYIPLGGSRGPKMQQIRNVLIIFVVSGFWHGANWTFVAWGALNAIYFIPLLLGGVHRRYLDVPSRGRLVPSSRESVAILSTFAMTNLAWVFFRAPSLSDAGAYLFRMFTGPFAIPSFGLMRHLPVVALVLIWEWIMRDREHGLDDLALPTPARWALYLGLAWSVLYSIGTEKPFIYFQF